MFFATSTFFTSNSVSLSSDPYFNYVTLLLSSNSPNNQQNSAFKDSATSNPGGWTITRTGNTSQGVFTPFVLNDGYWSNYFPGSGNYLTPSAGNAVYNPGATGEWTFECWIYPTSSGAFYGVGGGGVYDNSISCYWGGAGNTNKFTFLQGNGSSNPVNIVSSITSTPNTWYHYAVSKDSSNVIRMFINGTQAGTATYSGAISSGNRPVINGVNDNNGLGNDGSASYISNLRWVKGGCLYTSNFTPSTQPLTTSVSSGTCYLLFAQSNRFRDVSNTSAFVPSGAPSVEAFTPFQTITNTDGGSIYFDGTGDYLTPNNGIPLGAGDFTIDFWLYSSRQASYGTNLYTIFSGEYSGSGEGWGLSVTTYDQIAKYFGLSFTYGTYGAYTVGLTTNNYLSSRTWQHIAVTRTSNIWRIFVDGVSQTLSTQNQASSFNTANNFNNSAMIKNIGESFQGYIHGLRVVVGSSLYSSNFSLPTVPPTAVSGTTLLLSSTNAGIIDVTGKTVIETVGDAKVSTAISKFGTGSIIFDGTGDYLSGVKNIPVGSGDFTIECFVYLASGALGVDRHFIQLDVGTSSTSVLLALNGVDNKARFLLRNDAGTNNIDLYSASALTTGVWYHIAGVVSGSTAYLFVEGSLAATGSVTGTRNNSGTNLLIGVNTGTTTRYMSGNIEQPRITVGVARYTSNFSVPTEAFPRYPSTNSSLPPYMNYLVVAGGGGGGRFIAGGGGAGGVLQSTTSGSYTLTHTSPLTVTVGLGGGSDANGNDSVLGVLTALAGGKGGTADSGPSGQPGGSGGGGAAPNNTGGGLGTAGPPRQGYNGGSGQGGAGGGNAAAGGGGGAGGVGQNSQSNQQPGAGGIGITTTIITASMATTNSVGQVSGGQVYFAGGGGGGGDGQSNTSSGGLGGGGGGFSNANGQSATANTGGGGGGAGAPPRTGGSGGSGVVIIAYPSIYNNIATITGLTYVLDTTSRPGYKVYIFKSGTGTISWS